MTGFLAPNAQTDDRRLELYRVSVLRQERVLRQTKLCVIIPPGWHRGGQLNLIVHFGRKEEDRIICSLQCCILRPIDWIMICEEDGTHAYDGEIR